MIEIVISMLLLGLLALAFLPVLITSLRLTSANATIAVAAQLATGQLEEARAEGHLCSDITIPQGASVVPGTVHLDGANLEVRRERGECPTLASAYPTTISLQVEIWRTGTPEVIMHADTLILVTAP